MDFKVGDCILVSGIIDFREFHDTLGTIVRIANLGNGNYNILYQSNKDSDLHFYQGANALVIRFAPDDEWYVPPFACYPIQQEKLE